MKTALLYMTVSVPVDYDETRFTETQALDAAEAAAQDAIRQALENRAIGLDGKHTDCRGPHLAPEHEAHPEGGSPLDKPTGEDEG